MDGGVREKQKVDELKGQIKRRRRRASNSPRQIISHAAGPLQPDFTLPPPPYNVTAPAQPWLLPDVQILPTPPPPLPANDAWSTQPASPPVTAETANYSSDVSLFESLDPVLQFNEHEEPSDLPPLVTGTNDGTAQGVTELSLTTDTGLVMTEVWTPLATPTFHGLQSALDDLTDFTTLGLEPGLLGSESTTSLDQSNRNSTVDILVEEANSTDIRGVLGEPCTDIAEMIDMAQFCAEYEECYPIDSAVDVPCATSWTDQSDFSSSVELLVADRFPYMAANLRAVLRERMLWPHEATQEIVHASTQAMLGSLRSRSLQRWSLCCDTATVPRPEMDRARYMLPGRIHPPMPTVCVEELVIAILQMVLLQVDDGCLTRGHLEETANFVKHNCLAVNAAPDSLIDLSYGFVVVADSIAAASGVGAGRGSCMSHEAGLDNSALVQISGCPPWVFATIRDVSSLRAWRQSLIESEALNVMELANRASQIQQQIDRHRVEMSSQGHCLEVSQLTEVFAYATQVYIHTTVSGAFPNVPDVRTSVDQVIASLRRLSSGRQLRHLAWPVCVAASMASREHDTFFEALERGASGVHESYLSLTRALAIGRECQRLRGSQQRDGHLQRPCDWFDAMRSLEKDWVLV